ncbi:MAG: hypothetical protein IJN25_02430 [Clostridia bacterium]|nr:hypothetical protein [Clostridia bacterium]
MFLKRILVLTLLCILCLSPGTNAGAADAAITNPSFETLRADNGFPSSWSRSHSDRITTNSDKQYVHSGDYSLKFAQTVSDYPYARTTITGIVGGAEYTFGAWALTMNQNVGLRFRFTCIDENGVWLHDAMGLESYNGYTGSWYHFTEKFRPPRGTVSMYLQLRISSPGEAYYDDVSISMTDGPEMLYDFESDSTFIYSDSTGNGTVSVKVDTAYYPELSGEDVTFSLFREDAPETILKTQTVKVPENGEASFSYPVSLLSEKLKGYTVKCSFKPPEGEEIVKTHTVYKVDRPTHIDKKGFFLDENNKIFTPSIMYGVNSEHFDKLEEVGVNAVQGYHSTEWLDALHERKMKCFVVLYGGGNSAGSAARLSTTVKYVKSAMEHPAVFGWLIFDEPNAGKSTDLEELVNAYLAIREIDSDHPIVITANNHYDVLHQYTDAIIQDSYPYNNTRFTTYPYTRNVQAVAESDGRPVYHLMQTFEHLNTFPQPQEVRNMQYASLWAGCKGFGCFKYKDCTSGGDNLDETALWAPMKAFAEREQEIALNLFIYNKYEKIGEAETEACQWGVWKDDEEYFVIVRSKKYNESITAEVSVTAEGSWQAQPIGGTLQSFSSGNGKASVTVGAGDVVLLRMKKALFLTEDGEPVTEIKAGMKLNVLTGVETDDTNSPLLFISVVREDAGTEECVDVRIPDYTVTASGENKNVYSVDETVEIPRGMGRYSVKIFYWNRSLHCLDEARQVG